MFDVKDHTTNAQKQGRGRSSCRKARTDLRVSKDVTTGQENMDMGAVV